MLQDAPPAHLAAAQAVARNLDTATKTVTTWNAWAARTEGAPGWMRGGRAPPQPGPRSPTPARFFRSAEVSRPFAPDGETACLGRRDARSAVEQPPGARSPWSS